MRKLLTVGMLVVAAGSAAKAQTHGGEVIEIPLRVDGGRLLVPVQAPDGTEFEFVLSTGTPPTVFSKSTAARLGDQTGLTLGGLQVDLEGLVTLPDEELSSDGLMIAGMVGSQTLSKFDVLIDVPGERLVLKSIGRAVDWEGMTMSEPVRLRVYHGVILGLDVEFNGKEYGATLDLSSPMLIVNEPVRADAQIDDKDVGTLALGNTSLPDLPVQVRDLDIFERWDPNGDGFVMVGASVAYDCAISLSWVHREMRTCVR
jgi:hypothetical protein